MVEKIRLAEKILGSEIKKPSSEELENRIKIRRSIAAAQDLSEGTELSINNFTWVRPGTGIPPGQENLLLGHKLTRTLKQGELILLEDVSK
jgi:N,N'-diacetyllegionaminate synthase